MLTCRLAGQHHFGYGRYIRSFCGDYGMVAKKAVDRVKSLHAENSYVNRRFRAQGERALPTFDDNTRVLVCRLLPIFAIQTRRQ